MAKINGTVTIDQNILNDIYDTLEAATEDNATDLTVFLEIKNKKVTGGTVTGSCTTEWSANFGERL